MKVLSSLVIVIIPFFAYGQQPFPTYADDGAWSVYRAIMGVPYGTEVVQFSGTTDMCGHTYSIMPATFAGGWGYFRNEGQRTLFRRTPDCMDREYLAYDYSLAVGDTAYVGIVPTCSPFDTAMVIVSTISSDVYSGVERRKFNLILDWCYSGEPEHYFHPMEWIEGIGCTRHPFYSLQCIVDNCEQFTNLSCYDSSGVALYRVVPNATCHQNIGLDEVANENQAPFTVNSTNDLVQAHYPANFTHGVFRVFDVTGREYVSIRVTSSQTTIRSIALPSAVLLAVLTDDQERRWTTRWLNTP